MNHVLKYVKSVKALDYEVPSVNTYWADKATHSIVRVTRFEKKTQESFQESVVCLEYLDSGIRFDHTLDRLHAEFIRVSTPPSEKPFAWFRKFFDKRQILSMRDVERLSLDSLQHLYVMNGLSVGSFVKHRAHSKVPFSIPKLIIPLSGSLRALSVWESWAPLDLLAHYKLPTILESQFFRSAVARGHLYILSTKYARHLLAQSETQSEIQRMKEVADFVAGQRLPRSLGLDDVPTDKQDMPPYYSDLEVSGTSNGAFASTLSKHVEIYSGADDYEED